jgi:hypothetical protein
MPQLGIYDGCGVLHAVAKALRAESAILNGGRSLLSMNQPGRFRLPGLRLARSETHQLLRVLREPRQGGRLKLPGDRTVGIDEKPKPEFRTDQLDSGTLKPPNPTPVGATDTGAIDHSHKG